MASKQNRTKSNNTQKKRTTSKSNNKATSRKTNATAGKKNGKNTNMGVDKTTSKNTNKKDLDNIQEDGIIQDEIILVVALVISLLLILSFFQLGGAFGKFVSGLLLGLFGLPAYIVPVIFFFGMAFHISNMGNRTAGRKIMSAIVFFVALTALVQLLTTPFDDTVKLLDYYSHSKEHKNGGGLLGGLLVMFLCKGFGQVGAYIIIIAIMSVSVIVITGKALLTYIAKQSKNSLEERREYQKLKREQQAVEVLPTELGTRRPPKTFILDPDLASMGMSESSKTKQVMQNSEVKEKRQRKAQKEENSPEDNLPIINLDHLFPVVDKPNLEQGTAATSPSLTVPTYEDELRSKFGDTETNQNSEFQPELAEVQVISPTETMAQEPAQQETTPVEEKKISVKKDSTPVESMDIKQISEVKEYIFPPMKLLNAPKIKATKGNSDQHLKETAIKLQTTLESFGVHVTITNISCGPAVTRYELQPEQGVKVKSITSLADDIKLSLAAAEIRIEAPIPGKSAVGIEVPNKENSMVTLREILENKSFSDHHSGLAFAVGKDIGGQTVVTDIAKMPHLLIAGATGSGKSVCINTLIMSILYKSNPSDVRLMMIDPKVVELSVYNGIPHLLIPVVTDPKKASAALNWAVMEMTERYKKFADHGVRDLKGYNDKVAEIEHLNDENYQKLPQIVIIIDELADLMMVAPGEVEDAICRLAQMARAAGLHLIIATQRPSVNVITGLIKANVPSRVAFAVSSAIDSRTIIDGSGAEKLLGKGDMLFFPSGYPKPVRIQGAFVSDKEVSAVVDFLKQNNSEAQYSDEINEKIANARPGEGIPGAGGNDRDDYFIEAGKFIIEKDKASIGMLQRIYKIGFNRAARIMDQLSDAGVVGPEEGTKPRKVLMSQEEFENYIEENG